MIWMAGLLFLLEMVRPLPLRDNRGRHRGFPIATVSLVTINVIVHIIVVWIAAPSTEAQSEIYRTFGVVPDAVLEQNGLGALSLITSGFLHADWWHLLGNMFLLWFFGRKVEDLTGSGHFFLFYLLCLMGEGIISTLGRSALSPLEGLIPSIGASGAVSGIMAAYLFLYADERITTLIFVVIFPIPVLFRLPVWTYIVYNFGHDLLLGLLAKEIIKQYGYSPLGVDIFGHIGGLIAGLIFFYLYLAPDALVAQRRD